MNALAALLWTRAAWALDSARIDDHTALLSSPAAPLADRGADSSAVWVSVPEAADGSVVVFFHGNDGFVTASAARPEGFVPSWASRAMPPRAVGVAYELSTLSDVGPLRPLVMLPEVGVYDTVRAAFATTSAGQWGKGDIRDPLGSLVTDSFLQLRGLGYRVPDPERVIVAAHSGGGRLAAALLRSSSYTDHAVDVLMLDSTYGWGETADWVSVLHAWESFAETQSNRMVLAYIQGTGTHVQARAILDAARAEGLPVTRVVWGSEGFEEKLRTSGLVGLSIPPAAVNHGAMPRAVLPVLVRTADH